MTAQFLNKVAPDREQDLASFDLFGELLVYAKVHSFQLPSTTLPLLLLLEMFKFGDNRMWYSGTRSPGSQVREALESDVHHGEFWWRFYFCVTSGNLCGPFKQILGYLKTPGYATDLEIAHSLFHFFIFYTELGHVSVNSKDFFRDWDCRCRISTRDILCQSWTIA